MIAIIGSAEGTGHGNGNGDSFSFTSRYFAGWANRVVVGQCTFGSDCTTGNACFDGVRNHGETGVDCGGPCQACPCPPGKHRCGDVCFLNWLECPL